MSFLSRKVAAAGLLGAVIAAALSASAPPPVLVRGPYLQMLGRTSVTIVWRTDVPAACSLAIAPVGGVATVLAGDTGVDCTIVASGLAPGTEYAYVPQADGTSLAPAAVFRTDGGESRFSFLVVGDSGSGGAKQAAIRDAMAATPADFILHVGDMVYEEGAWDEYDPNFFRPYASLLRRLTLWPVLGNHDIKTENGAPWRAAFVTPANNPAGSEEYYSFDFGSAHVAVLDGNDNTAPGSPQHTFLATDLAASNAPWKFVAFHQSIYSSGAHGSDLDLRADLVPLFDQYDVDVVFMGHEHDYERTVVLRANQPAPAGTGTLYITSGGGGAEVRAVRRSSFTAYSEALFHYVRVEVDGGWLRLQMIREDGVVRDSVVLERGGTPPVPVCGDGIVNRSVEECDGVDRPACPAACLPDCTCPPRCGDGRTEAGETCDRGDDAACPGRCLASCECGTPEQFLTVTAVADTHVVTGDEATWDHGAAPELVVDDEATSIAYLKFDLRALAAPVRAATLRLRCTNASGDGGTVYAIADSSWIEGDRPGTDASSAAGPGLVWTQVDDSGDGKVNWRDTSPFAPDVRRWVALLGRVSAGTAVTVDVTPAIQSGPGPYTLVVKNDDDNGARYVAREGAIEAERPRLQVELGPIPSCDDGVVCTADHWDPTAGCVHSDLPDCCRADDVCDDADTCNGVETCERATGLCRAGTPLACDDGAVCTTDGCDPAHGCTHTIIAGCCTDDAGCADGNACNGAETCDRPTGACRPGTPPACDDGVRCTADACDPAGGCTHTAIAGCCTDDAACADADVCNGGETCERATGVCRPGTPLACEDGLLCTTDACDPTRGCVHAPVDGCCTRDAECDDHDACNGIETCSPATHACARSAPPACDDQDACTVDRCEAAVGCVATLLPGFDGADCVLRTLQGANVCADVLDPRTRRVLARRLRRARTLLAKARRIASPRPLARVMAQTDRQLAAVLRLATRTLPADGSTACRTRLVRTMGDARGALDRQSSLPVR